MSELDIVLRLFFSALLGGIIGLEREGAHKPAGLRTHMFVALGSTLFTLISTVGIPQGVSTSYTYDPSRIIAAILTGIGFIGAGVIIHRDNQQVEGITTAAGLLVSSAIGIAIGVGFYVAALFTVFLSIAILLGLGRVEAKIVKKKKPDLNNDHTLG